MKILFLFLLFFLLKVNAQPGQLLFDDTYVHTVELMFSQPDFYDSLTANYESKSYLRADIRIDGSPAILVGARFKGYSSYMFYPGRKKSFKIDINEFVSGQKYDGLKKFNLHNGYLDPTFQREKLVSDVLLEADVPASRVAFANVIVNGENWGIYTLVEQIDKTFLEDSWFGNDNGNLFKARATSLEWIGNADSLYYDQFDLKTNEQQNNWQDLVQFIEQINLSSSSDFPSVLGSHLNIERYLKGWAVRNLFVDLDTYFHSGNNFYLYNNGGQFEWICWDFNTAVGTTFGWALSDLQNLSLFYLPQNSNRPLNERILNSPSLRNNYVQSVELLLQTSVTQPALFNKIDQLADMLRPFIAGDTLKMFTNPECELNLQSNLTYLLDGQFPILIPGLKDFLGVRLQAVQAEISALGISDIQNHPEGVMLSQNYPNPFNPVTQIPFALAQPGNISLELFDINGKLVKKLQSGYLQAGTHSYQLDASALSSGIYFYRLSTPNVTLSRQLVLLR